MNVKRSLIGFLALAAVSSCGPDDQRTDTIDPRRAMQRRENMPPAAVAQLDSGSQAFREHRFEAALDHYSQVTELAPDVGAGWFGVYMAHDALGNPEAAAEALERAEEAIGSESLIHGDSVGLP